MTTRNASFLLLIGLAASPLAAQGQFRTGRLYRPPTLGYGDLYNASAADVTGDGHVDLLLARDYQGVSLMVNDGRGSFTNETATRLPRPANDYATYQVDAADVDGDGDRDLVVANDHVYPNKLLINNGQGVFTDQSQRFPTNGNWTTAQAILDAEGDGDLDVLFYNYNQAHHLFLNDGRGNFSDGSAGLPAFSAGYKPDAATGDLDGDGDVDVLVVQGGYPHVVLENTGGARFVLSTRIVLPVNSSTNIAPRIRDVDRDGRLDVLFAGGRRLLLAQGGGQFLDVSATHLPPTGSGGGQFADVDLDGDADVVASQTLWLNDGKGIFTDASARMTVSYQMQYAVVDDLDSDGDPDLYSLRDNKVVMNFHRQIDAVARPELGKTYALDFHVRPGYATASNVILPFFSTGTGQLAVPQLGIFGLALSPLFVLPPITVPASGTQTLSVPIPQDPALLNLLLGYQALVFDAPVHLGNVVTDPVLS